MLEGFCNFFHCLLRAPGAGFECVCAMSAPPDEVDLSNLDPAFDGVLRRVPGGLSTRCEYFQDRNKRWPFRCDDEGYTLLARLLHAATPVVKAVQAKIDTKCDVTNDPESKARATKIVMEGQNIYARKPNMGEHDVTWSQSEYGHLGLQKEYIRYKSVQRLTEAWACLQRAYRNGLFEDLDDGVCDDKNNKIPLRWATLGGGPGFELLAVKWFFEAHFPRYELDLVSLDLENSWRGAATCLGLRFNTWDVLDGDNLEKAAGGPVDFAIVSYVLKMYMANTQCAKWLGEKLNSQTNALRLVLVVSRDENLEQASQLIKDPSIGNATIVPLMDPSLGRDDRQLAVCKTGWQRCANVNGKESGKKEKPLTFPNVPYEEHKKKRVGGYQAMGKQSEHGGGHYGNDGYGGQSGDRHRDGGFRRGGWSDHKSRDSGYNARPRDAGRW